MHQVNINICLRKVKISVLKVKIYQNCVFLTSKFVKVLVLRSKFRFLRSTVIKVLVLRSKFIKIFVKVLVLRSKFVRISVFKVKILVLRSKRKLPRDGPCQNIPRRSFRRFSSTLPPVNGHVTKKSKDLSNECE